MSAPGYSTYVASNNKYILQINIIEKNTQGINKSTISIQTEYTEKKHADDKYS